MAEIDALARQTSSVQHVSEGADVYLRANRSGVVVIEDEIDALIKEGRGFQTIVGSFSTPATGGGVGNILDQDQPDLVVTIPSGTSIRPFRIDIVFEQPVGAADDNVVEALISVDQDTAIPATSGTSTTGTIYNLNTLYARASACRATNQYSVNMTNPTLDLELAHWTSIFESFSAVNVWEHQRHLLYEPKTPPIIRGPARLIVYWGGTVETHAFCTAQWVEFPSTFA